MDVAYQDHGGFFAGKRVLITGGLGFIGSNLAHALLDLDSNVTLLDSLIPQYGGNMRNIADIQARVRVNLSDMRDRYALARLVEEADIVFNLAGQTSHVDSMSDPQTDLDINARAQIYLLEALREANPSARVVFASTRQLYGRPQYLPVDERHPIVPVDVNGINKWAGEAYHLLYSQVYGLRATVLRLTNTYGPRMRVRDARQTFLGVWLRQALTNHPIQVFGTGRQLRDFTYVSDAVHALLLASASEAAVGEVFNLGGSEVVDLVTLAELLCELQPGATYAVVPFPEERRSIDIGDYFGDFGRIQQTLGWKPAVDLATGLRACLDFYRREGEYYWGSP